MMKIAAGALIKKQRGAKVSDYKMVTLPGLESIRLFHSYRTHPVRLARIGAYRMVGRLVALEKNTFADRRHALEGWLV